MPGIHVYFLCTYNSLFSSSHSHGSPHDHVHCNDEIIENANARICHTSHTAPCSQSMTGTMGLFAALSLHSAIEGIAIGVQNSPTKVRIGLKMISTYNVRHFLFPGFVSAWCGSLP